MKKRYYLIVALLIATVMVATGFSSEKQYDLSHYKLNGMELCYDVPNEEDILTVIQPKVSYSLFLGKTYVGFKEALGFKESRGEYSVVNEYGYMGKYQFSKGTLKLIGIYNPDSFLNDSRLQESAFTANAARNKWILRRDIKRFKGRYVGGVKITESGILAAAHLAGPGNVKKYLRSGGVQVFNDAFGTSIKHYLRKFSGCDTSHIVPNRKARVL